MDSLRALLCLSLVVSAGAASASTTSVAIIDTTVIPMDTERAIPHQTVVIRDGIIAAIGPAVSTDVPAHAKRVDGRGRFLMPGLADMHTHVDSLDQLPLFLQAGVTTILNMGLASPQFVARDRKLVDEGRAVGPHVFAAFMIDGPGDPGPQFVPACASEARDAVDRAKLVGYEFIKVYQRLKPDIFEAVMDEARTIGLPVAGHIVTAVGLEKSLAAGQVMIAHAEEYWKTYLQQSGDDAQIAQAVALTRESGAYVTPNLSAFEMITARTATPETVDRIVNSAEARAVPPAVRASWEGQKGSKPSPKFIPEFETLRKLTLEMSRAGVPLLAGTDTPGVAGMIPGVSIHDDLRNLVATGLTPFQALSAATRVPGEFIQKFVPGSGKFGTIAAGNRADLIVLPANPLEAVANARHPLGVVAGGRWYTAAQLEALVARRIPEYDAIIAAEKRFTVAVGAHSAAAAIRTLPPRPAIPESFFNTLGYRLLNGKRMDDAIAIFELNVRLHPESWNAYDSLGEADLDAGRNDEALRNYRISLALNPRNAGAERILRQAGPVG